MRGVKLLRRISTKQNVNPSCLRSILRNDHDSSHPQQMTAFATFRLADSGLRHQSFKKVSRCFSFLRDLSRLPSFRIPCVARLAASQEIHFEKRGMLSLRGISDGFGVRNKEGQQKHGKEISDSPNSIFSPSPLLNQSHELSKFHH